MSRSFQYIGLNGAARKLVDGCVRGQRGSFDPQWYGDDVPLYYYQLHDGKEIEEFLQAIHWSSGPCAFVALLDKDGPIPGSMWTDTEMEEYL